VGYATTNDSTTNEYEQRTAIINKIRMLQRTRRNTIGRRNMRLHKTSRAFPLWLERQSSFLLSFVRFSYQF